jgi:hypothetical protein
VLMCWCVDVLMCYVFMCWRVDVLTRCWWQPVLAVIIEKLLVKRFADLKRRIFRDEFVINL